jgi:exosortase K
MTVAITNAQSHMAVVHWRINRLLTAMLAVVVMLMLKRHYSLAGPDQLAWILSPTAHLTAWLTSATPAWEAGVGYADFGRGIIIVPACAGINFMIMAFGLAVFCALGRLRRLTVLTAWMAAALPVAYVLTLGVNTLRIAVSMALYQADIYSAWLTPGLLHRFVGVWLYLGVLGLFFKGLQPIINALGYRFDPCCRPERVIWPGWLPLLWYLAGAVGVPVVNLVFRPPVPAFGKHGLMVIAAAVVLWGGVGLTKLLLDRQLNRNWLNGNNTDRGG